VAEICYYYDYLSDGTIGSLFDGYFKIRWGL